MLNTEVLARSIKTALDIGAHDVSYRRAAEVAAHLYQGAIEHEWLGMPSSDDSLRAWARKLNEALR